MYPCDLWACFPPGLSAHLRCRSCPRAHRPVCPVRPPVRSLRLVEPKGGGHSQHWARLTVCPHFLKFVESSGKGRLRPRLSPLVTLGCGGCEDSMGLGSPNPGGVRRAGGPGGRCCGALLCPKEQMGLPQATPESWAMSECLSAPPKASSGSIIPEHACGAGQPRLHATLPRGCVGVAVPKKDFFPERTPQARSARSAPGIRAFF